MSQTFNTVNFVAVGSVDGVCTAAAVLRNAASPAPTPAPILKKETRRLLVCSCGCEPHLYSVNCPQCGLETAYLRYDEEEEEK